MILYRKASPLDLDDVLALLGSHHLPTSDVAKHLDHFVVATLNEKIIGCIGMELYQQDALLRSLAVNTDYRGQRIGTELYAKLADIARENGAVTFHLLTTTAEAYFSKRGFVLTDRSLSPAVIQSTAEFSELCPSTARYMTKQV